MNNKFHKCNWPNCEKEVPSELWGCKKHWYMLPHVLRNKVVSSETTGNLGMACVSYASAAEEIQGWIERYGR
jgi:hypothetical protein